MISCVHDDVLPHDIFRDDVQSFLLFCLSLRLLGVFPLIFDAFQVAYRVVPHDGLHEVHEVHEGAYHLIFKEKKAGNKQEFS